MSTLFDRLSVKGRRALVTGSSRGIGASIAVALAEAGADVAVNYVGNADAAEAVSEQIKKNGVKSFIIQADLGCSDGTKKIVDDISAAWGGLDILVANASIQIPEPWDKVSRENFDSQVTTNLRSSYELIKCFAPEMLKQGWGRILTIGSVQEACPHPDMLIYSSLKSAQTLMVKNLAKQFAAEGVTVNNIAPGVINTDRSRERLVDADYSQKVVSKIPAGYIGEPEDCAAAAVLLCSDAGRYITGQNLFIDGGMSV